MPHIPSFHEPEWPPRNCVCMVCEKPGDVEASIILGFSFHCCGPCSYLLTRTADSVAKEGFGLYEPIRETLVEMAKECRATAQICAKVFKKEMEKP